MRAHRLRGSREITETIKRDIRLSNSVSASPISASSSLKTHLCGITKINCLTGDYIPRVPSLSSPSSSIPSPRLPSVSSSSRRSSCKLRRRQVLDATLKISGTLYFTAIQRAKQRERERERERENACVCEDKAGDFVRSHTSLDSRSAQTHAGDKIHEYASSI